MYNRLKIIYQLQQIDNQLDELEELRGDLPNMVRELEEQIKGFVSDIEEKEKEQKDSVKSRNENEDEIEKLKENQKKFKAQLYQVRNNKEYDALTKEIDHTEDQINKLEAENNTLADRSKVLTQEIEDISPRVEELKKELGTLADIRNWKFVFGEPNQIKQVFESMETNLQLDETLGTPYVFIIDKNKNLRGRQEDEDEGVKYGFNATSVAELNNKMEDDVKVILAEYRLALKKNNAERNQQ